jgi:uncharacterized protein YcbX
VTAAVLSGLAVYPVKSCRGIAVPRARMAARGLMLDNGAIPAGDREWMIVDDEGRFISQREVPLLALVETAITEVGLRLSIRGHAPIDVPFAPRDAAREVVVWSSTVHAHDAGPQVAAWLAAALGVAARLVRFDPAHERRCNPQFAGDSGAHTMFADAYPLLVTGEASLADLNERLGAKSHAALPMNRFRPNLVLSGLPAFEEDHLDALEVDGVVIKLVKPCTRCTIPTTDQATAVRGDEPLATLAGYRMNDTLEGVTFGMNAIVVAGTGLELAVGSAVHCTYKF